MGISQFVDTQHIEKSLSDMQKAPKIDPEKSAIALVSAHEKTSNHPLATTTVAGMMSIADKVKLDGVASGATKNATDADLRDRSKHTGTQGISTIEGLQAALEGKQALTNVTILPIPLNPTTGWSPVAGYGIPEVTKSGNGWVSCDGVLIRTLTPARGEIIGTLPAGFRPRKKLRFPSIGTSSASSEPYIEVDTAGQLIYQNAGSIPLTNSTITLSSICFYA